MKNYCFDTIYNITQEPQELQRLLCLWVYRQVCCDKISSIAVSTSQQQLPHLLLLKSPTGQCGLKTNRMSILIIINANQCASVLAIAIWCGHYIVLDSQHLSFLLPSLMSQDNVEPFSEYNFIILQLKRQTECRIIMVLIVFDLKTIIELSIEYISRHWLQNVNKRICNGSVNPMKVTNKCGSKSQQ